MTEVKHPEDLFNDVNVSKDISNNLGEQLKQSNTETTYGKKLQELKTKIDESKIILKTISLDKSKEDAEIKTKQIIDNLYKGNNKIKQYSYLLKKETVTEVVRQAYIIIASKEEAFEKAQSVFNEEMGVS